MTHSLCDHGSDVLKVNLLGGGLACLRQVLSHGQDWCSISEAETTWVH